MERWALKAWWLDQVVVVLMDWNGQVYWSVPAALLVRFRGEVLGDALSERQDVNMSCFFCNMYIKSSMKNIFEHQRNKRVVDSKNEPTHGIKRLLRDPANVHITHTTSAFLDFHWQSLSL